MNASPVVVPALPALELWRAVSRDVLNKSVEDHVLWLTDSDRNWLAFRESAAAAADRGSLDEALGKENMLLIRVLISNTGVGQFVCEGKLRPNLQYAAWRWMEDMPFEIRDDQGNLLLQIDPNVMMIE